MYISAVMTGKEHISVHATWHCRTSTTSDWRHRDKSISPSRGSARLDSQFHVSRPTGGRSLEDTGRNISTHTNVVKLSPCKLKAILSTRSLKFGLQFDLF